MGRKSTEDGRTKGATGEAVEGEGDADKCGTGAELRERLSDADGPMAMAAFAAEDEPREERDIVIPSELLVAMEADGATIELGMGFLNAVVEPASLATQKRTEAGTDDEDWDVDEWLHSFIVSYFGGGFTWNHE